MLPAAQASLITLPDELLCSILLRVWADRPARPAAEEVRAAAGLASVCRRARALLKNRALPLALDFSAARLSAAQEGWLLAPAQAGRVEAASFEFYDPDSWRNVNYDAESTAFCVDLPLLNKVLALHGGTLLRLSGVPVQLVTCESQEGRPALDLSGLRLTKLGVDCLDIDQLPVDIEFWPERLPGSLEELELLNLWNGGFCAAWRPSSVAGLAGRLPRLQTLRITSSRHAEHLAVGEELLEGFGRLLDLVVHGPSVYVDARVFERVRSVRVEAGRVGVSPGGVYDDVGVFVGQLCSASLQAAELCAHVDLMDPEDAITHEIVGELIRRCGDRFAVEVGTADEPPDGRYWHKAYLLRLAWRRWPAPGAPDLPAARAAHERARAWAADIQRDDY